MLEYIKKVKLILIYYNISYE